MKSKTVIFFIFVLSSVATQAQDFYLRGGLGAAICTSPHYWYHGSGSGQTSTIGANKSGVGDGLPFVLAAGCQLSKNIGIELGVDYFQGFNYKITESFTSNVSTIKLNAAMLSIVPAIVIRLPLDKFSPYARLGLKLGVLQSAKETDNTTIYNTGSTSKYEDISKDYGGVSVGAQVSVGTDFKIGNHVSLFAEVNSDVISWSPKKGKLTKRTTNGVNTLDNLTTSQKSWVYEKTADNESTPSSEPAKKTLINYSYANTGIVVGVKLRFGKN